LTKRQRGIVLIAVAFLAIILIGIFARTQIRDRTDEQDADRATSKPVTTAGSDGSSVLHIKPATQARIGLRTQVLTLEKLKPELVAYGKLEEDPSRSFVLRAPISGILHYAPGRDWPSMGEHLADGTVIGVIEPRFTPAERISLTNQLAAAEAELKASTASVSAARSAYERAKILNADNKNVSDQVLQDAAARLQAEEARFQAATQTVRQIEASLQVTDATGSRRLVAERGGEVVELIAQPGESIEPGSPILRAAKLNEFLARIQIPVGQHIPASVTTARIIAVGFEQEPLVGKRVAIAPSVDPRIQGQAFLFRLTNIPFGLRPGVAVTAYLDLPGASQPGIIIPQSAVVRFQGSGFAYVQTATDGFLRKPVPLDRPTNGGYFATENFQPGDRVVLTGAAALLSEEFKPQVTDTDE